MPVVLDAGVGVGVQITRGWTYYWNGATFFFLTGREWLLAAVVSMAVFATVIYLRQRSHRNMRDYEPSGL